MLAKGDMAVREVEEKARKIEAEKKELDKQVGFAPQIFSILASIGFQFKCRIRQCRERDLTNDKAINFKTR